MYFYIVISGTTFAYFMGEGFSTKDVFMIDAVNQLHEIGQVLA